MIYSYPPNLTPINPGAPYTFQAYAITGSIPAIAPELPTAGEILGGLEAGAATIALPFVATADLLMMQGDNAQSPQCRQEWEDAYRKCSELLSKPNPPRRLTGGYRDIRSCAKGFVSEKCGGNPIDWGR